MRVLKIISKELALKIDYLKKDNRAIELATDGNGDLIISKEILSDGCFAEFHKDILEGTEEIEYVTTEGKNIILKSGDEKYSMLSSETIKK